MRKRIQLLPILCVAAISFGCGPRNSASSIGKANDKGSGSERTSDGSESVPGYLSDLALVGFERQGDRIKIFGKPGAIVSDKGSAVGTLIIILDVDVGQFIRVSATAAETGPTERSDFKNLVDPDPTLPPTEEHASLSLAGGAEQIIYGDQVASTRSRQDGSFAVEYKCAPGSENPFVVTIGQKEGTSFALLQNQSPNKIVAVFGSLAKFLTTTNFVVLDWESAVGFGEAAKESDAAGNLKNGGGDDDGKEGGTGEGLNTVDPNDPEGGTDGTGGA